MRINAATMLAGALVMILLGGNALAGVDVSVGYADNIRPSPFFPSPWNGSANTIFAGGGASIDAGAIMVTNNTGAALTFNSLVVDGFGDGASFGIWGAYAGTVIPVGWNMIFTQTGSYNFDSSDDSDSNPAAIPKVHLGLNSDPVMTLADTAQVLNTEGTDHLALAGLNESHEWRLIGTFGGQAAPMPSAVLGGGALMGLFTSLRFLRRRAA